MGHAGSSPLTSVVALGSHAPSQSIRTIPGPPGHPRSVGLAGGPGEAGASPALSRNCDATFIVAKSEHPSRKRPGLYSLRVKGNGSQADPNPGPGLPGARFGGPGSSGCGDSWQPEEEGAMADPLSCESGFFCWCWFAVVSHPPAEHLRGGIK